MLRRQWLTCICLSLLYSQLLCELEGDPIEIVGDFSNLRPHDSEFSILIEKLIWPEAITFVSSWLRVLSPSPGKIPAQPDALGCLGGLETSSASRVERLGHLLVLLRLVDRSDSDFQVEGFVCPSEVEFADGRPRVAAVTFNAARLRKSAEGVRAAVEMTIEALLKTLLFNPELLRRAPAGVTKDGELTMFSGPNVLEWGRAHFDCDEFEGMPAAAEGRGFDRRFAGDEVLTPGPKQRGVVSRLTMAVLRDSGWFDVDFSKAEPNAWGRDAGCEFLAPGCNAKKFAEFCDKSDDSAAGCASDQRGKARCLQIGDCNLRVANVGMGAACGGGFFASGEGIVGPRLRGEFFGGFARCFEVQASWMTGRSAGCLMSFCSDDLKRIYVVGTRGTTVCDRPGLAIALETYTLLCPDPKKFCATSGLTSCPEDCGGRGRCNYRRECVCDFAFEGIACEKLKDFAKILPSSLAKKLMQDIVPEFDMTILDAYVSHLSLVLISIFAILA